MIRPELKNDAGMETEEEENCATHVMKQLKCKKEENTSLYSWRIVGSTIIICTLLGVILMTTHSKAKIRNKANDSDPFTNNTDEEKMKDEQGLDKNSVSNLVTLDPTIEVTRRKRFINVNAMKILKPLTRFTTMDRQKHVAKQVYDRVQDTASNETEEEESSGDIEGSGFTKDIEEVVAPVKIIEKDKENCIELHWIPVKESEMDDSGLSWKKVTDESKSKDVSFKTMEYLRVRRQSPTDKRHDSVSILDSNLRSNAILNIVGVKKGDKVNTSKKDNDKESRTENANTKLKNNVRVKRATITEIDDSGSMDGAWRGGNNDVELYPDPVNASQGLGTPLGSIKKFMFALANPIFQSLRRNENIRVFKKFTSFIIPQTGLQSHARGGLVRQQVENGNYQQALDTLKEHRMQVDMDRLFSQPWNHASITYGECRKIIPSLDYLLMERLKAQTTVTTSLLQSLYIDIKKYIRKELEVAEEYLGELGKETDMLGEMLSDLVKESLWERITIFIVCCGTLIMCVLAIWIIRQSQMMQQEYCTNITEKMDLLAEQNSQLSKRHLLRPRPSHFSFSGESPTPNINRKVVMRDPGRL